MKWSVKYFESNPKEVCRDLDCLNPLMLKCVKELIKLKPDVLVVETGRSNSRQHIMFKSGKSKTDNSLHEVFMAIDYISRSQGYNAPKSWWMDIRKTWTDICNRNGYHKVIFPGFELGHLSLNNGTRC